MMEEGRKNRRKEVKGGDEDRKKKLGKEVKRKVRK